MGCNSKGFHLFILLFFSLILTTLAVRSPRSFIINQNGLESSSPDSPHVLVTQVGIVNKEVDWVREAGKREGRVDIELTDYEGTRANTNHDPRNPGNSG